MNRLDPIKFVRICTMNLQLLEACQDRLIDRAALEDLHQRAFSLKPKPDGKPQDRYYLAADFERVLADNRIQEADRRQLKAHLQVHEAIEVPELSSAKDFTLFFAREVPRADAHEEPGALERLLRTRSASARAGENFSFDCTTWLWCPDMPGKAAYGRALICPCRKGEAWSLTFRKVAAYPDEGKEPDYLNHIKEIGAVLRELIFPEASPPLEKHGLIVISGRTGAAKSTIARLLFNAYLTPPEAGSERRPHLLTFEDPIEELLDESDERDQVKRAKHQARWQSLDYTPRELGVDASDLSEVVNNALRQTPKVLFVGETRAAADWRKLLEFAGTGHLVITTTHAGSLTETMSKLLRAIEADTATERSELAERVLALIHLRGDKVQADDKEVQIAIPALWQRTPNGIKALMAEGLSALLPHNPKDETTAKQYSSIGRLWFARKLTDKRTLKFAPPQEQRLCADVLNRALKWDLEGI